MPKDLTVVIEDRPGTLADVTEALGKAGVNIEGTAGFPCEGQGIGHVLVDDTAAARKAIQGGGGKVTEERDVLLVKIPNRPGALGEVARKIANAGVNIDLVYLASGERFAFGVDDLDKGRKAIGG